MGQNLTHGVYLPDEGERNCYNGLAANWQILDNTVGTVAEHTSQIAGKAPAVHTHTKSDITDLFNSANTWSGDNTYSKPVAIERSTDTGNFLALKNTVAELGSTPASATPVTIAYRDKNNDNLGYMGVYYDTDGSNHFRLYVRNKYTSGAPSTSGTPDYTFFGLRLNADRSKEGILRASFRPYDNNTYDLGSSSYQWNNLYASKIRQVDSFSSYADVYQVLDSSSNRIVSFRITKGTNKNTLGINVHDQNNSAPKGLVIENDLSNNITITGGGINNYLGTSTNKWTTLNGINPGALSFPSGGTTENTDWFNVAGSILPTGGNATDLTGGQNFFTPSKDGWLCLVVKDCSYISVWDNSSKMGQSLYAPDTTKNQQILLPVLANHSLEIRVIGSSWLAARLFMPKGNV